MNINKDVERVLISEEEIKQKVEELAAQITKDYAGKSIFMITLLKGGVLFGVDLMRKIDLPIEIDFMSASSYGSGTTTSGVITIDKDITASIEGKHVLIAEDIIDSGYTLSKVKEVLLSRNPASLKICTILYKPAREKVHVDIDYRGFEIPDEFVVGYGLDYDQKYRNLPYIGVLKRSVYENK